MFFFGYILDLFEPREEVIFDTQSWSNTLPSKEIVFGDDVDIIVSFCVRGTTLGLNDITLTPQGQVAQPLFTLAYQPLLQTLRLGRQVFVTPNDAGSARAQIVVRGMQWRKGVKVSYI